MRIPVIKVSVIRDGSCDVNSLLDCPERVAAAYRAIVGDDERENLLAFYLDAQSKIKSICVVSIGTLSASLVHPREVFRPAVIAGAAAVIVAHHHPSGDCSPSADDRDTTLRLRKAGEILGIPVLDHVIIAGENRYSFRESGLMS